MNNFRLLRSSALLPNDSNYEPEFNSLTLMLSKIPNDVDLRPILRFRPLQPKHCLSLEDMHSQMFPIQYDSRFFEVSCSTIQDPLINRLSFFDVFDFKSSNSLDSGWDGTQILSIGCFFPKKYMDYNRDTGSYDIEGYLVYLNAIGDTNIDYNDPFTELVSYDPECDEYMVGFVTILLNMDKTNSLISDEDYNIIENFYNDKIKPLILDNNATDRVPKNTYITNDDEVIRKSLSLNTVMMDDVFYQIIYNYIYNNVEMLNYIRLFSIRGVKTFYILSTGITMGLRKRFLGTTLILFIQVLLYFGCFGAYLYNGKLYDSTCLKIHQKKQMFENIRLYYNNIVFKNNRLLKLYYRYILEYDLDNYDLHIDKECLIEHKVKYDVDCLPFVVYLHTIDYNNLATNMYKRINFIHVNNIIDYYSIDDQKFKANFLAFYMW